IRRAVRGRGAIRDGAECVETAVHMGRAAAFSGLCVAARGNLGAARLPRRPALVLQRWTGRQRGGRICRDPRVPRTAILNDAFCLRAAVAILRLLRGDLTWRSVTARYQLYSGSRFAMAVLDLKRRFMAPHKTIHDKLSELASNLWWSWQPEVTLIY